MRRLLCSSSSRNRIAAAAALLCLAGSSAFVRPPRAQTGAQTNPAVVRSAQPASWERAERGREELEAVPPGSRSRAAYARVMDRFRAIYHDDPGDLHAPASVCAVAELLAEEGSGFHDAKSSRAAVAQYEFLRAQYPGSSLRVAALLAEAEIEQNDLHDDAAARERYRTLLKRYPRSEQAEEARAGLDGIGSSRSNATINFSPDATIAQPSSGKRPTSPSDARIIGDPGTPVPTPNDSTLPVSPRREGHTAPAYSPAAQGAAERVRSIRHWSTPTYTRVAIDLTGEITFEAARVPNPDRIYFDLHHTVLAPELVGKSFSVTDDGFLKKIRAAQFSGDMTRIVLDVNDVSEYSAFLLPNPSRLIIDIHGGTRTTSIPAASNPTVPSPAAPNPVASNGAAPAASAAPASTVVADNPPAANLNASSLPSTAPTVAPSFIRSAPTTGNLTRDVPNTVAVRSANSADVASLSTQPGRVDATTLPTSQPIAAVVPRRRVSSGNVNEPASTSARKKTNLPATTVGVTTPNAVAGSAAAAKPPSTRSPTTPTVSRSANMFTGLPARAATPTADGETSLTRALGLKIGRIVIDPGHGGHDSGTLGVDGLEEKDVVLDVALRLGKLLHERLGAEIVYTRSDDTFIPLETRTAIANKAQADLFLSIHANSSPDESARGVETYYLNFTSSPDALETAARENAVSSQSIHQLSDLVKKITLRDKIDESREFASDVEQSLYTGLARGNAGLKDRGVKKAPFVVLIGANMPSILAEISFVTNSRDAEQLRQPDYRQRVAESLYKGVACYESGLGGTKSSTLRASAGTK